MSLDVLDKPSNPELVTHKKLKLIIEGEGRIRLGTWDHLMRLAVNYPHRNWRIVEELTGIGERIITEHHRQEPLRS